MDPGEGTLGHRHWERERDTETWTLEEGHWDMDTGQGH